MKRHVAALALILFLGSLTTPSGVPQDPVLAQLAERRHVPEVAGAEPVHGANGGTPPRTAGLVPQASPSGAISAIYSASMTWCAPTPTQCQSWGGTAELAAVNSFRWGDRPYWVRIWRGQDYADALVVSHCQCNGQHGYIDVSPHVFRQLAALSRGRVDVAVEVLDWPVGDDPPPHPDDDRMRLEDQVTAPPTDVDR